MSDTNDNPSGGAKDISPAQPLEISSEIAAKADDLLRNFAEEAGLETALVVDRSGALVAGISSEAEVTIDVISALVAGASGAMRALVKELGETGNIESLHQGGDRLLYLREMINRFILVGVSDCMTPAGVVREEASKVSDALQDLLAGIRQSEPPKEQKNLAPMKSLRSMSLQRTSNRLLAPAIFLGDDEIPETAVEIVGKEDAPSSLDELEVESEVEGGPVEATEPFFEPAPIIEPEAAVAPEAVEDAEAAIEEEIFIEESVEDDELPVEATESDLPVEEKLESVFEKDETDSDEHVLDLEPVEESKEPEPEPEPKEILEPLDFGEPEIVIERPNLKKSPFEEEEIDFEIAAPIEQEQPEDVSVDAAETGSVFEVAVEEEEPEPAPAPVFELDSEEPDSIEVDSDDEEESETVFEFDESEIEIDEDDSPEEAPVIAFEIDEDDDDDDEEDDSDDEDEGRTAGPFYF